MEIINLTPHAINVITKSGTKTFPPSGAVARVDQTLKESFQDDGIPFFTSTFGDVSGLPDATPNGPTFIVSGLVKSALRDRTDLVSPADLVRDEQGRVIGCKGFIL